MNQDRADREFHERQAACRCLPDERRSFIQNAMQFASDFNDGAFLAYMEQSGIDTSELECFSLEHDCRKENANVSRT